jgi:hypothetical protein
MGTRLRRPQVVSNPPGESDPRSTGGRNAATADVKRQQQLLPKRQHRDDPTLRRRRDRLGKLGNG